MFGKLGKAFVGSLVGAIGSWLITKIPIAQMSQVLGGLVAVSDLVALGIFGVLAYMTRNKENVNTIFTVAAGFQLAAIVAKILFLVTSPVVT